MEKTLENAEQPVMQPAPLEEVVETTIDETIETEPETEAPLTAEQIMERMRVIASDDSAEITTDGLNDLKRQFYWLHNDALRLQRQAFIDAGGDPDTFVPPVDPLEDEFKTLMTQVKEKKARQRAAIEAQQLANLDRKRQIIAQLNELAADTDNVNRHYPQAKELQAQFKAIGEVPQTDATDTWKAYQDAVELFYDQWKVNKELRDYDFKKNLAEKQLLISETEKLNDEEDIVTAFKRMLELHDKWRQIGPVAKEFREDIWNTFKDASAVISKRYQAFFEERKAREAENEAQKTQLCEQIEAIDTNTLKGFSAWNKATRQILEAQEAWKKLGFASRKVNNALFARFRQCCDNFFAAKATFFQSLKSEQEQNLAAKTALCEEAEALKDSTQWKETTDKLVALQQQWKKIGAAPKKFSDEVWERFVKACDYFFEQKKNANSAHRKSEQANLATKREIVDKLTALNAPDCTTSREEAIPQIHALRAQWQQTGHVPFKEKDKLHDTYREVVRQLFDKFDIHDNKAKAQAFESSIEQMGDDKTRLSRERERLMRTYEGRKTDLKTYENNLGFFSSRSKSGEAMLRDMQGKIERLKKEIAELESKISIIDSKF